MIKLDVYCGMLGAGKTTLIRRMLQTAYQGCTVAIVENEIGKVNLDAAELADRSLAVKEITGGCICCTIQSDFAAAIQALSSSVQPDYIVVEPSGAADLYAVLDACRQVPGISLNRCIAVVNGRKILSLLKVAGPFLTDQISLSTHGYISRSEQLSPERLHEIEAELLRINPALMIVTAAAADIRAESFPELHEAKPVMYAIAVSRPICQAASEVTVRQPIRPGVPKIVVSRKARQSVKAGSHARPAGNILPSGTAAPAGEITVRWLRSLTDTELQQLTVLTKQSEWSGVHRIKGYFPAANGTIMKLDYVYGEWSRETRSDFPADKIGICVLIGENMPMKLITSQLGRLGAEVL